MNESERLKNSKYDTVVIATNNQAPRDRSLLESIQREAAKPIVLRELIERLIVCHHPLRSEKARNMVIRVRTLAFLQNPKYGHLREATSFDRETDPFITEIEDDIEKIRTDKKILETEMKQLIDARRGQGLFRRRVKQIEPACRVTGIDNPDHLRASHIKPWRNSTNAERLDGHNGLLLAPHIDHLFDRGFISFEDGGKMLVSPHLNAEVLKAWSIPREIYSGKFKPQQCIYLAQHRKLFGFKP